MFYLKLNFKREKKTNLNTSYGENNFIIYLGEWTMFVDGRRNLQELHRSGDEKKKRDEGNVQTIVNVFAAVRVLFIEKRSRRESFGRWESGK